MRQRKHFSLFPLVLLALFFGAAGAALAQPGANARGVAGAVYAMTNAEGGNAVLAYDRLPDGTLALSAAYPTGGQGFVGGTLIDPLGSQGSLTLSDDGRWLLAVNAASDEVSVFRVRPKGLTLTDVVDSGGAFPVSVAVHRDQVYVLNAGGDEITGFALSPKGRLTALEGSTRGLSGVGTAPAQVGFTPDGSHLVVTEKATRQIDVFPLDSTGIPGEGVFTPSAGGTTPFGFVFNQRRRLLMSEVEGSVSSYELRPDGTLDPVSANVVNGQAATCWIAGDGRRFAFTANTGSGTVSHYAASPDGAVALLEGAAANLDGAAPIDTAVTPSGRFLYTLNAASGTVGMFAVNPDGSLAPLGEVGGLPVDDGAQGIAAR